MTPYTSPLTSAAGAPPFPLLELPKRDASEGDSKLAPEFDGRDSDAAHVWVTLAAAAAKVRNPPELAEERFAGSSGLLSNLDPPTTAVASGGVRLRVSSRNVIAFA